MWLAERLDMAVETGTTQDFLQPVVERMALRPRQLRPAQQQLALPLRLPTQRHAFPLGHHTVTESRSGGFRQHAAMRNDELLR